jgi:hypothetical protein
VTSSARTICANTPATQGWSVDLLRAELFRLARGEVQAGTVGSVNIAVNENEPVAFVVPAEGVAAYDDYTGVSARLVSFAQGPYTGKGQERPSPQSRAAGGRTRGRRTCPICRNLG